MTTTTITETDEHRCQRPGCGRKLTSPQSKRRGYGPTCWRILAAALAGLSDDQVDEAIEIVELGAVRPTNRPAIWLVDSTDFDATYRVTPDGACDCRHGVKRLHADDQPCKHVGAVRLTIAITPRRLTTAITPRPLALPFAA